MTEAFELFPGGSPVDIGLGPSTGLVSAIITAELVSNARTAPASTPSDLTTLLRYDSTNVVVLWTYIPAVAAWKGVELE